VTRVCLSALFAHWRRNPLLLFTFLTGLAIATALWSGVQAINAEARASYDAAAATLGGAQFGQLRPRAGDTVAQDVYIALRRAGWQVSPVLEGRIDPGGGTVRIVGLDPLTAPAGIAAQRPSSRSGPTNRPASRSPRTTYSHASSGA